MRYLITLVMATVLFISGCYHKPSYEPPETCPVSGNLITSSQKIPAGSLIKLFPKTGKHIPEGDIQEDGSFTLKTLFHEEWLSGAVQGEYTHATILIPIGLGPLGGSTIQHKETFIVDPKGNHFKITLN